MPVNTPHDHFKGIVKAPKSRTFELDELAVAGVGGWNIVGLGCWVCDLGPRVWDFGFKVWGPGSI